MADQRDPPPGFQSHSKGRVWTSVKFDVLIAELRGMTTMHPDGVIPNQAAWDWRDRMLALLSGEAG